MFIQAITHTEPCYPPGIAGRIPSNGQHWVRLGTGGLCGNRDCWRVTDTASFDIKYVFRSFEFVGNRQSYLFH
jgi:hypothetical protein